MAEQQKKAYMTKAAYDRLIKLSLDAKPLEACGILASSNASLEGKEALQEAEQAVIDIIIPITNIHINPTYEFKFDPEEWTAAYYDMQKNRQKLVGLFHSHPRTDAVPSQSDSSGFLPASGLSYWIISLKNLQSPYVQPYHMISGEFVPAQLMLT